MPPSDLPAYIPDYCPTSLFLNNYYNENNFIILLSKLVTIIIGIELLELDKATARSKSDN